MSSAENWGLLPDDVRRELRRLEWDNRRHLRQRLLGQRSLPLRLSLRPPSGAQALQNLEQLRQFIQAWKDWSGPGQLHHSTHNYRQLGEQNLPTHLELHSLADLFQLMGRDIQRTVEKLDTTLRPLLQLDSALYAPLIEQLNAVEQLSTDDAQRLADLLPQMHAGLGQGNYLRALPVQGVDSKFIENNSGLIETLLDTLHDGAISGAGGLQPWLGYQSSPSGWLLVRPLCQSTRQQLSGLRVLQLDTDTLIEHPLPGSRVLVIENLQSGLALPALDDTVAICGGGRNTRWLQAPWLRQRAIGYWGDIDTHGLTFLDQALQHQAHCNALLMDLASYHAHAHACTQEDKPLRRALSHLATPQQALYQHLLRTDPKANRLEQERLDSQLIRHTLQQWAS